MSAVNNNRRLPSSQRTRNICESSKKNLLAREKLERSLQTRASLQSASLQSFHIRANRFHSYGCTPSLSKVQQLAHKRVQRTPEERSLKAFSSRSQLSPESIHRQLTPVASFYSSENAITTLKAMSPNPPVTERTLLMNKPHFYSKHPRRSTSIVNKHDSLSSAYSLSERLLPVKPPTPPTSVNHSRTSESRIQYDSYFGPRRGDVTLIGRKMAPVLRVIPANTKFRERPSYREKNQNTTNEDAEITSQKRVRFSDQLGYPLVRNMTPNYRRKHTYILRWLETAGRSTQTLA